MFPHRIEYKNACKARLVDAEAKMSQEKAKLNEAIAKYDEAYGKVEEAEAIHKKNVVELQADLLDIAKLVACEAKMLTQSNQEDKVNQLCVDLSISKSSNPEVIEKLANCRKIKDKINQRYDIEVCHKKSSEAHHEKVRRAQEKLDKAQNKILEASADFREVIIGMDDEK